MKITICYRIIFKIPYWWIKFCDVLQATLFIFKWCVGHKLTFFFFFFFFFLFFSFFFFLEWWLLYPAVCYVRSVVIHFEIVGLSWLRSSMLLLNDVKYSSNLGKWLWIVSHLVVIVLFMLGLITFRCFLFEWPWFIPNRWRIQRNRLSYELNRVIEH